MEQNQVRTPVPRLIASFFVGFGPTMMLILVPTALLLTFKMAEIDPNNYTSSYGLVAAVGAFFALLGNPIGGAISDRTNNNFGRRRTWILIGPVIAAISLASIGFATEVWQVLIGWCAAQFFMNFGMAAYTGLIPDQVPEDKRGTVSGFYGLIVPVFMIIGMSLMMIFTDLPTSSKWMLIAIIGGVGPILSLFLIKEGKNESVLEPKKEASTITEKISKVYPNPKKFPEFTWAVFSKFLMMMGMAGGMYLTMMLINRMNYTQEAATAAVGTIQIAGVGAMALTSILGGMWSDKVRKQKIFLYVASVIMAIGLLIYAFVPEFTALLIATIILNLGTGCFMAVDTALVSRILPNKEDAAKDFGIMNVANTLPQSIVPAIAPLLLVIGSWQFFYIFIAACVVIGMLTIKPIPEVGEPMKCEK